MSDAEVGRPEDVVSVFDQLRFLPRRRYRSTMVRQIRTRIAARKHLIPGTRCGASLSPRMARHTAASGRNAIRRYGASIELHHAHALAEPGSAGSATGAQKPREFLR